EVIVATEGPIGRWRVHVDARSGAPIAREQLLRFAVQVRYNVPRRQPAAARYDAPAALTGFVVGGAPQVSDAAGNLPIDAPVAITTTTTGPLVAVQTAQGSPTTVDWVVGPGDTLIWNQAADELVDAQLSASIHTNIVKDYVRKIGATVPWMDQQIQATVNIDDICNAFSDGDSINFFVSGFGCENTARLADVVYHEFGHSIHFQALIPGVGAFHPSLSEGISDYLSATITNDASLAPGFFSDSPDEPLRELDPVGLEWHWPEDQGEVHDEGRIIGGALWDLRKILRGKLGTAAGTARAARSPSSAIAEQACVAPTTTVATRLWRLARCAVGAVRAVAAVSAVSEVSGVSPGTAALSGCRGVSAIAAVAEQDAAVLTIRSDGSAVRAVSYDQHSVFDEFALMGRADPPVVPVGSTGTVGARRAVVGTESHASAGTE
ncbi:MAG: hypothetical protein KDB50_05400, partial [Mycobacterium sp.]|nr:hypothetical protein [Mycobacterium sp.]